MNLRVLRYHIAWLKTQLGYEVKIIQLDGEIDHNRVKGWAENKGIEIEPSELNTMSQNGLAERLGGVIMENPGL